MEIRSATLSMKTRLLQFLEQQPRRWLWAEAVLLSSFVGFIDYITGYEISVVLFYSVPILLMVWFGDRRSAVFIALLCSIIWWWADEASEHPYTQGWHQIWETIVRLGYFLLFVVGGSTLKSRIQLLEHLRRLEQEIVRISEYEQRRIGQDLHDGLCQYYAAVGCAAGSLKHNLEKQGSPVVKSAAEIEDLIMKGVSQARSLARGLAPVENDERGLQFALEELAESTRKLLSIECQFISDGPVSIFDNTQAGHLYRIAQEAINNAHRHGKATVLDMHLTAEAGFVTMVIEDNGVGIPQALPAHSGMGLSLMKYRARLIGGRLEITPRHGGGTVITCAFRQNTPSISTHAYATD